MCIVKFILAFNSGFKSNAQTCSRGESFCLSTGRCEKRCRTTDDGNNSNDGSKALRNIPSIRCQPGQVFCMASGLCRGKSDYFWVVILELYIQKHSNLIVII